MDPTDQVTAQDMLDFIKRVDVVIAIGDGLVEKNKSLQARIKSLEDTEREISKYIHMFFEISEIVKKVRP